MGFILFIWTNWKTLNTSQSPCIKHLKSFLFVALLIWKCRDCSIVDRVLIFFNKPIILKNIKICRLAVYCRRNSACLADSFSWRSSWMYMLMLSWHWKKCKLCEVLIREFQVDAMIAFAHFSCLTSLHQGLLCESRITPICAPSWYAMV